MDKPRDVAKHPARRIGADAVAIFIGGMAGTLARWGLDTWTLPISESYFTWSAVTFGVIVANLLGAFLLGYFKTRANRKGTGLHRLGTPVKLGITTGLLGSFTTFSAFGIAAVSGKKSSLHSDLWALGSSFCSAAALAIILLVIGVVLAGLGYRLATKDAPGGRAKSGRGQER
ncbi:CrcB family protein [Varibaculum cambriense]|uniref:fluoride efflux transporter FluC n=1 Tax=Varibaculum cambriense TaxID=184870 RepID=UPI00241F926F|nr:CrcB family protein [Varibaculum cambriense]MBS5962815.1 CrcB family protein [Varibaculum cambriense]